MRLRSLIAAAFLCAAPAFAQPSPPPPEAPVSPDTLRDAAAAFSRGLAAMESGRHAEAVVAFQESYRLRAVTTVLYNLALAYRAHGQNLEAIATFERYLREAADTAPEARVAAIRDTLVSLRAACGTVALELVPADAAVTVDGRPPLFGASPQELLVDPGEHALRVEARGYVPQSSMVRVAAGAREALSLHLARVPEEFPPPPVEMGVQVTGRTTCVPNVRIVCPCGGGFSGFQVCNRDGTGMGACICPELQEMPGIASARPPPAPRVWYGAPIFIVDASAAGVALLGLTPVHEFAYVGLAVALLGGPIVHWANGQVGRGFGSFGIRVGAIGVAAFAGALLDADSAGTGAIVGAGVGFVGASLIDALAMARAPRRPYQSYAVPGVLPLAHGGGLSLSGAF